MLESVLKSHKICTTEYVSYNPESGSLHLQSMINFTCLQIIRRKTYDTRRFMKKKKK